jgi:eukaryotic-like serine/threonine-protein kinase
MSIMKERSRDGLDHAPSSGTGALAPPVEGEAPLPGYRVLAHLRRGNDVDVYEVWSDERACRCVAKVLRPDRRGDARPRRRLMREGRLLRRLAHLHLARAYAVHPDPPTLVLEVLTGQTLEHRIRETGRLPLAEVACLGLQLSSVLHYLHQQPWLHLDLKPSNVVCECGLAKVLDLSIARRPGRAPGGVGTRPYMAPEQARGGCLSFATDVWGLGAVLFEATSGRPPFPVRCDGPRYPQLVARAEPLSHCRRGLPPQFTALVDAALDPLPEGRPPLAEIMAVLASLS